MNVSRVDFMIFVALVAIAFLYIDFQLWRLKHSDAPAWTYITE